MGEPSHYERLGGEAPLRAIIDDFIERVVGDIMIGFFFQGVDKAQLKEREFELAASMLGGPQRYRGRPLREAHAKHPILGGQFARRSQILRQVLAKHGVPEDIASAWLEHTERLRSQITRQPGGQCID